MRFANCRAQSVLLRSVSAASNQNPGLVGESVHSSVWRTRRLLCPRCAQIVPVLWQTVFEMDDRVGNLTNALCALGGEAIGEEGGEKRRLYKMKGGVLPCWRVWLCSHWASDVQFLLLFLALDFRKNLASTVGVAVF